MAVRDGLMLAATQSYVEKIKGFAEELQIEFSEYQQMCVVNAVRTINPLIIKGGYNWQSFTVDNIISVLQKAAFLELNPSATPSECYYIIRNEKQKDGSWLPVIEFGIEGSGNDRILRKFGQDVVDLKSYIVYKGDDFTEGYMDGWNMTLPTYRRKFKTNKPLKVVYLIKKKNGEIDVQYADTSDVMKSLLANAKQNMMNAKDVNENELLRDIAKHDLYEILEDVEWLDKTITKKGYGSNKDYQAPLFNPSYTSPISMYNMIERKLRNHATRKYPKNFNVKELSNLYEDTFDEKYNEKGLLVTAEEQVQIASEQVEEQRASVPLQKVEQEDRPSLVVKETKPQEEEIIEELSQEEEIEETVVEETVVEETVVEETKEPETQKQELESEDGLPDWAK